jgi:hypothetical protein
MAFPIRRSLLALPVVLVACMSPLEVEEVGFIELVNSSEAPVESWRYTYCGDTEIQQVVFNTPTGQLAQGERATKPELADACTNHTFRLTNGRTIARSNLITPVNTTVQVVLLPPE